MKKPELTALPRPLAEIAGPTAALPTPPEPSDLLDRFEPSPPRRASTRAAEPSAPAVSAGGESAAPPIDLATCVADEHPVLQGRVRCRFDRATGEESGDAWLVCLAGVRPRVGDRVLVVRAGALGGLVVGVVDGLRRRHAAAARVEHLLRLRPDELVRLEGDDGRPLLELAAGPTGPVVRLLQPDLAIEAPGALRLEADSIALVARQGGVVVEATDDVAIHGEQIHLN